MSVSRLPPGIPREMVGRLAGRMLGNSPVEAGPGPVPVSPQMAAAQAQAPAAQQPPLPGMGPGGPAPPLPAPPPQGQGGPPGPNGQQEEQGLTDEQAALLRDLMANKKARKDIESIVRQVAGDKRNDSALRIDPVTRMSLAQGWNARVAGMGKELNRSRGMAPGASKTSDEALLRIYYTTPRDPNSPDDKPAFISLEDIDDYADAVRMHLIVQQGIQDEDQVEDTTMRWCFPLRESLIKGGRSWPERVEFVREMLKLTHQWLNKYGELPLPDPKVLLATERGKGDPESQVRNSDSQAYPPGPQQA